VTTQTDKLYIVDGSGYIYRAFFANQHLRTSTGTPTNAIYGFTAMLRALVKAEEPTHLAIAFDSGRDGWRRDLYPAYKENRSAKPEELAAQEPAIREIVDGYRIPVVQQAGMEADDLIATMVRKARAEGLDVVVVTSDKDLMQLVGPGVLMLDTMKDKRIGPKEVEEKFGVPPSGVIDVLALAGDTSDNIPGVPGIGPKTATALIQEFGSLEGVLANVDKVSGTKRRENLTAYADQARLSKQLVRLEDQCDIEFDLDALKVGDPDYPALKTVFERWEFWRLLEALQDEMGRRVARPAAVQVLATETAIVGDIEAVSAAVHACLEAKTYGLSLYATDPDPHRAHIVGIGLSAEDHKGFYIPVGHRYLGAPRQLPLGEVLGTLAPLLGEGKAAAVVHGAKRAMVLLSRHGIRIANVACDPMLAGYLLDPGKAGYSLPAMAADVLAYEARTLADVCGTGRRAMPPDEVSVEAAAGLCAQHADLSRLLWRALWPAVSDSGLGALHDDLEIPLSRVISRMERAGAPIDRGVLGALSTLWRGEIQTLEAQCFELLGRPFNLGSPKQLREILFDELGLASGKKTKTGRSTDQSVLETLTDEHPLPGLILEWRSFTKLTNTYVDALPALSHPDGRVRTDFNQVSAATGRLASNNPNLQNIPIRTKRGQEIRRAFVPRPGWKLLCADYSQIELRVVAHMSGDKELKLAFNRGEDIHRSTASKIFDTPPLLVTTEQRGVGKTINFGVTYGMGANRLSRDLGISRADAKRYIEAYFEKYSGVDGYFNDLVTQARRKGYAETMLGRRRPIPQLTAFQRNIRSLGERLAVNTPIQGTAADIMKRAMVELDRRIEGDGWEARMLMTVHDELVFEVPPGEVTEFRKLVEREMANAVPLDVPLVVDVGVGDTWLDAK
jgi:DNA polymerase I